MSLSFKNILVPTDFSEAGNNAIKIAVELCKEHNAVLHLLHVVENNYIITAPEPGIALSVVADEINNDAKLRMKNVYEAVTKMADISVQKHLHTGIPFDEICKAATQLPVDLIVMGTHGASGAREFFIGTTAYSVIKNTHRPVLSIPALFSAPLFKNVLFPVRPVEGIKSKYELLETIIKNPESTIHIAVLHVEGVDEQLPDNSEELQEVIAAVKNTGINCTKEKYSCKNFASKVLELSEMLTVDLIAINATLDFNWKQFFIGPYTQQVVNHAKVPVLSFRND